MLSIFNECLSSRTLRQRLNRKMKCVVYKGGKCSRCGYEKSLRALHFHHLDRATKSFSISFGIQNRSWKVLKLELDKCDLLCANCHSEEEERLVEGGLIRVSRLLEESDRQESARSKMVEDADKFFDDLFPVVSGQQAKDS